MASRSSSGSVYLITALKKVIPYSFNLETTVAWLLTVFVCSNNKTFIRASNGNASRALLALNLGIIRLEVQVLGSAQQDSRAAETVRIAEAGNYAFNFCLSQVEISAFGPNGPIVDATDCCHVNKSGLEETVPVRIPAHFSRCFWKARRVLSESFSSSEKGKISETLLQNVRTFGVNCTTRTLGRDILRRNKASQDTRAFNNDAPTTGQARYL